LFAIPYKTMKQKPESHYANAMYAHL